MQGNSGAKLNFVDGAVVKQCLDAAEQHEWFSRASSIPTAEGIYIPLTSAINRNSYSIEFIDGVCGTSSSSTLIIEALSSQILLWSNYPPANPNLTWQDYLTRLYSSHVVSCASEAVLEAFEFVEGSGINPPPTFCHGDLTLENVIFSSDGRLAIIDPNFKKDLFQSSILDFGKLLQSCHSNYHEVFDSNYAGVDLRPHNQLLLEKLESLGILKECLVAEISHIIRLRKYQPVEKQWKVDNILKKLLKNDTF